MSLIIDTLTEEGYFEKTKVSEPTVRRMYAAAGLPRRAKRGEGGTKTRLRWQTDRPGALWHGDVCHVTTCKLSGKPTPIRIHGMLDDASRYVVALEAHTTEKEVDMLGMLVDALRRWGKPDALYLDNGSTYRGEVLKTACARLEITLLHAKPYDPQARGKNLGRAIALGYANAGADVLISVARSPEEAAEVVALGEALPGTIQAVQADVTDDGDVDRLVQQALDVQRPDVDVLVNDAARDAVRQRHEQSPAVLGGGPAAWRPW